MQPIELVLRPATQPGTYWPVLNEKRLTEEQLTRATRQPFFDGARELLKRGIDPDTPLISRHEGSQTIALQSTVGEAARWSVSEADRGGLSKRPYRPWNADSHLPADASGDDEASGGIPVGIDPRGVSTSDCQDEYPRGISHDADSPVLRDFGNAQSDFARRYQRCVPKYKPINPEDLGDGA